VVSILKLLADQGKNHGTRRPLNMSGQVIDHMELQAFLAVFRESLQTEPHGKHTTYLFMADKVLDGTARYGLCFGCGKFFSLRKENVVSKKFMQLRGRWHCVDSGGFPEALLICSVEDFEEFVTQLKNVVVEDLPDEQQPPGWRARKEIEKIYAERLGVITAEELIASGKGVPMPEKPQMPMTDLELADAAEKTGLDIHKIEVDGVALSMPIPSLPNVTPKKTGPPSPKRKG